MNDATGHTDRPKVVLETETRPVVRDSEDNPVVRTRDLEQAITPIDTRQKVGFAVIGAIGTANLFGIQVKPESPLPTGSLFDRGVHLLHILQSVL